ncbi:MAG: hypothetical protein Q8O88_03730 [bacterium]|nr:hypothetical protein [bacterium]
MLKTNKNIESITIGRGDTGRYEYSDVSGVTELGDKVHRITVEVGLENEYVYFKHRENAEKFLLEK